MMTAVRTTAVIFICAMLGCASTRSADRVPDAPTRSVRFATFNAAMYGDRPGALAAELASGGSERAEKVAAIIQRVRPDVLLINEFDYDGRGNALRAFRERYLERSIAGDEPITYPYVFVPRVNTGLLAGVDLNGDGKIEAPADALGFGRFEGQFGMVLLSRYPIRSDRVRSFRLMFWRDVPGAKMPTGYYSPPAQLVMRLSSKTHADVPIDIGGRTVHTLISHPTPPVFDGEENRNGRRNHDEIRLWSAYLSPDESGWPINDMGRVTKLAEGEAFVVMGDLNADPLDGDSMPGAVQQLLDHPRVNGAITPTSAGAVADAEQEGGPNETHRSDPAADTADFDEPGNLRVDYVLPSVNLKAVGAGVFWPEPGEPGGAWIGVSDHRLVWVDIEVNAE